MGNKPYRIFNAIDSLTLNFNRFPARCELVSETGFSRQTINKHLKQYFGSKEHQEKKVEYIMLREKLLSRLYRFATKGDIKAAKVFFSATEEMEKNSLSVRNQQNNFIQINGPTITQELMKQLSEEQQDKVVELVQTLTPIMKTS